MYVVLERGRMTAAQHRSKASSTMEDHVLIYCRSTMVHNTIFTANNTMTRGQHTHTTMYVHYTVPYDCWPTVQYHGSRGHRHRPP